MFRDVKEKLTGPKDPTDFRLPHLDLSETIRQEYFFLRKKIFLKKIRKIRCENLFFDRNWTIVHNMVQVGMTTRIELCGRLNKYLRSHTVLIVWRQKTRGDLQCVLWQK